MMEISNRVKAIVFAIIFKYNLVYIFNFPHFPGVIETRNTLRLLYVDDFLSELD